MTRTPTPGRPRACRDCKANIPYPPAGLTRREETKRQHFRRQKGLPAEFCLAVLDSNGKPAVQCVKCAQEEYYRTNPEARPEVGPDA